MIRPHWTLADQHAAYRQGWGLFSDARSDLHLRVERLDDPSSLEGIVGLDDAAAWPGPMFECDDDAAAHVNRAAAAGDVLAARAIAVIAGSDR